MPSRTPRAPWRISATRAEAVNRLRECEQLLEGQSARGRVGNGWAVYSLGRACLLVGRLDEARRLAHRAVDAASGRIDFLPDALQLLGDIATHPDCFDAESGETQYREALALAESRGMRPLIAHCHLGLGKLYARLGKREQATEALAEAAAMYRDMDMPFWLGQVQAELVALG